ncbi:hypothetical protein [Asaia sp. HN010]|uniref:hypothetical protein n=1 Tax=Asaia sp. HN010 TaxID=3081233 RepID=UPI00301A575E
MARAQLSRLKVPQVEPYIFASHQRHDLQDVVAARAEKMLEMYCLTGRDLRLRPATRLLGKGLYEGFSTRQRNIGKCVYKRSPEHSHEDIPRFLPLHDAIGDVAFRKGLLRQRPVESIATIADHFELIDVMRHVLLQSRRKFFPVCARKCRDEASKSNTPVDTDWRPILDKSDAQKRYEEEIEHD